MYIHDKIIFVGKGEAQSPS